MYQIFLLLFIPVIGLSQIKCDSLHDYIDCSTIQYQFYDDLGLVTSSVTPFYTNDSVLTFLHLPVDSIDWTDSWRNDNGYGPYTSLKSYTYCKEKRSEKTENSCLTIFHTNNGDIDFLEMGFSNDSTFLMIDSIIFNNQTSIEEIKRKYYCSWMLYELERDSGLIYLKKHSPSQKYSPVRFHITDDVKELRTGYDRITHLLSEHLIMFFEDNRLVRVQIFTGS